MPLMDYRDLIPDLGPTRTYDGPARFNTHDHLRTEFERLGFSCGQEGSILIVSKDGGVCAFVESVTSFTSHLGSRILKDKRLANRFLARSGITVAEQHAFAPDRLAEAERVVERLGSVVIEPADGNKGRGVTVGVTVETLHEAWELSNAEASSAILVESHFQGGVEARYLVIDGSCAAVVRRVPPHVRGDGSSTVLELIIARNAQRKLNPSLAMRPILLDNHRLRVMGGQGFDPTSVPQVGQLVLIDTKAGLSTGGDAMDITDSVHPEMRDIAERAARIVPGLDVVGFDILARDHALPPGPGHYIVIEGNTRPDLGGHMFPSFGESRNVCRLIALACVKKMGLQTDTLPEGAAVAPPVPAMPLSPELARPDSAGLLSIPVAPRMTSAQGTGTLVLGGGYLSGSQLSDPKVARGAGAADG